MRCAIVAILAAASAMPAGDPAGFSIFRGADLTGKARKLAPKLDAHKVAAEPLADWGNHRMSVALREGDGEAEWHEKQADIFIARSGEATLVYGGKMVDAKTTAPGEMRGTSISGGMRRRLAPGDIVHIPVKTPHQMLVQKQFIYATVKVDQ